MKRNKKRQEKEGRYKTRLNMKNKLQAVKQFFKRIKYENLVIYSALILISYQFMYPLLRMIMTSLMSQEDIINPTVNWLPKSGSFGNLRMALRVLDLKNTLINSILFSGVLALCQTLISAMTGYAFARYQFKFKNFWFILSYLLLSCQRRSCLSPAP